MSEINIFSDYIVPGLAGIAVIQPWLIFLHNKVIRKPKLDIIPTGYIEIGYSNLGPTIALIGTIVSKTKDIFINEIIVELIRKEDNLTHNFRWLYFHSPDYNLIDPRSASVRIPHSFQLQKDTPHNFSISFQDETTHLKMYNEVMNISKKWDDMVKNKEIDENLLNKLKEAALKNPLQLPPSDLWVLIKPLNETIEHTEAYRKITELNYWKNGKYEITMNMILSGTKKIIQWNTSFNLSEEDEEKLRLNTVNITTNPIFSSIGFKPFLYTFRNQKYLNKSEKIILLK